jgi:E3 ubiquitin-protein ligase DOA10
MAIEVLLFPMMCGGALCICAKWVFPVADSQPPFSYMQFAPTTSAFWYWTVGSYYM